MSEIFNVYCDESCHLENDNQTSMVLGAVWCPKDKTREIAVRLREIKEKHGIPALFEVKWTKVSPAQVAMYLNLIDYFFDDDDLHFRALIVPDKSKLRHDAIQGQDHDTWYFKMYFNMLKVIIDLGANYNIYIDIKDTRSSEKTSKLHDVLSNNVYDYSRKVINCIQLVHSHEIEQLQLADLLIGAISYTNRNLSGSPAKNSLVERIRQRSGYSLSQTTPYKEEKINLFCWQAQEFE